MTNQIEKTDEQWRQELTPEAYKVLRRKGTERPFTGDYVHTKEDGIYRCAACDAELFSSDTKFNSGTGWPSSADPGQPRQRRAAHRPQPVHAPHRGDLRRLRRAGAWATLSTTVRTAATRSASTPSPSSSTRRRSSRRQASVGYSRQVRRHTIAEHPAAPGVPPAARAAVTTASPLISAPCRRRLPSMTASVVPLARAPPACARAHETVVHASRSPARRS